ncbi:MAG: hypothetical protein IIZ30_07420 [Sphingomonas sp.]|uniref:hypothetical protein n=1 Tax=Sphingomonas sp. TaxID=28214 RepID=UPI00257C0948|nr:hypothetical protein [Sphingomonas sp.]MBQ1479850.1 hypothetical protein [Sphingomonas sp.]
MSMVIVLVAMLLVGEAAWRSRDARLLIITIGSLFIIMALQRGYYWHIFERGSGPFTANRMSALAAFVAAAVLSPMLHRLKSHPA